MNKLGPWIQMVAIALAGCSTVSNDTAPAQVSPMQPTRDSSYPFIAPPQVLSGFTPDPAPDEQPDQRMKIFVE
jgi:hypothetical protein